MYYIAMMQNDDLGEEKMNHKVENISKLIVGERSIETSVSKVSKETGAVLTELVMKSDKEKITFQVR